ncbi:hypothetical protein LLH03_03220 [bacterium]|nr:hypothetical protein [bacterium]
MEQEKLRAAKREGYFTNRASYDAGARYAREHALQAASDLEQQGKPSAALAAYQAFYHAYPECPGGREITLKMGALARSLGDHAAACEYYLQALETGADRCFSTYARLSENQRYLDEVAKPLPQEMLEEAFEGLNACLRPGKLGDELPQSALPSFADRWYSALRATYLPTSGAWLSGWLALAEQVPVHPWADLCRLAAAEGLLREARYSEAERLLGQLCGKALAPPQITRRAALLQAQALMGLRRFREAEMALNVACGASVIVGERRTGASPEVLDHACRLLAWRLEQAGCFDLASRCYQRVARESLSVWQRRQGEYALKRVAELSRQPLALGESVLSLPEDRTARGYWPLGYGLESYVLCGQQFYLDRAAGSGPALIYHFATTDAKEPSRLWVSAKRDGDPAAPWDPVGRSYRSANRDDCGERRAVGEGPDLLVTLEVPAGTHLLSLYFVNDHNYYEPNREYTVSITDAQQRLQALAEVRDFGGGVYKRFAVSGPQKLLVRLWRNLSMNVLISGLFLDPPKSPATAPQLTSLPSADLSPQVRDQYERTAAEVSEKPLAALRAGGTLGPLVDDLQRLLSSSLSPGTRPTVLWMLAEGHRLLGQPRRSEELFDQYLTSLGAVLHGQQLTSAYDELAAVLQSREVDRSPLVLAAERRLCRDGNHRLDRVWKAYLRALPSAYVDSNARAQALLAPFGKTSRYASLSRTGLLILAEACLRAGQGERAEKLLVEYKSTYGQDASYDRLRAACHG